MKIKVWKKSHEDIDIIIRNIGEIFEYIFVWRGKIYSAHIEIKLPFWRNFRKEKYTDKEIQGAVNLIFISAKTTIEELSKQKKKDDQK